VSEQAVNPNPAPSPEASSRKALLAAVIVLTSLAGVLLGVLYP
jgi:hypothetical protein